MTTQSGESRSNGRFLIAAIIVATVIGVAAATVSCSPADEPSNRDSLLRRSLNTDLDSLDPHKYSTVEAGVVLRDIGEGLVSYSAGGDVIPGVAESWTVSSDGKSYVFLLRGDAKWSDGTAVTAHDFVYSFRRLLNSNTASPWAKQFTSIANATGVLSGEVSAEELGVRAKSSRQLVIQLTNTVPYFLQLLTHPATFPVQKKNIDDFGDQFTRPMRLVSNGAYTLQDWKVGSSVSLEKNSSYWDSGGVYFNNVNYLILPLDAEVNRYRAGELDITASVAPAVFEILRKERPDELRVSPTLGTYYYGFNFRKAWLRDNPKLRQALSMAIDREVLVNSITRRGEQAAYGWVPPGVSNYESQRFDYAHMDRAEMERKAKELYEQAGFNRDQPLSIEIRFNSQGGHKSIALAIQAMWKKVLGVEAKLVNEEFKVMISNIREATDTEVFRLNWSGDYNDAMTFLQLAKTGEPQNLTGYSNPKIDSLLDAADIETDVVIRADYLQQAERLMLSDHPILPLYFYVSKHLVGGDIVGWHSNLLDVHYSKDLSRAN